MCLISPWYTHGNIRTYLENNPNSNRLKYVSSVLGLSPHKDKQISRCWISPPASNFCIARQLPMGTSKGFVSCFIL
jgi:hypothetical protein